MQLDGKQCAFVRDNNIFIKNLESGEENQITFDGQINNVINGATDWVYEEEFSFDRGLYWNPKSDRIAYYKFNEDKTDHTLMVCSLGPFHSKQDLVRLPLEEIGNQPVRVTDVITGNSYLWDKEWNFVELTPDLPFLLFKIHKK